MAFSEKYYPYLVNLDLEAAWAFLGSLEGEELREAKAWFQRRHTAMWRDAYQDPEFVNLSEELRREVSAAYILSLGPIRLLGPKTAARMVLWPHFWMHQDRGRAFLIQCLCEADRDWAAVFVEEASAQPAGDEGWALAAILRTVAIHHGLSCPTGNTFLKWWSAGALNCWPHHSGHDGVIEWLTSDPFMPDLLFRYLASGHCGHSTWLPQALPELVARGAVDRDAIVAHVLALLTAPQRPVSQKVLVGILDSLELKAETVPGGCGYFLGVIATSTGLVGKYLLPMAIETLSTPDELVELATIIGGRPEKAQKLTLLAALGSAELRKRLGVQAVCDAILLLASGNDAAFATKARSVLQDLTGETPVIAEERTTVEGHAGSWTLWEQPPTPVGVPYGKDWFDARYDPTFANVVDNSIYTTEARRSRLVDDLLTAMASGTFEPAEALMELRTTLSGRRLSMPVTLTVLRDLFLGGGLRQGYQLGLGLAEGVVGSCTRQSGTADLIRLLVEFAAEIPPRERPELPAHLAALAQGPGSTKSQAEARALRDRLAERPAQTVPPGVTAPALPHRGLWDRSVEPGLAGYRLPPADRRYATALLSLDDRSGGMRDLTGCTNQFDPEMRSPSALGVYFCRPDLLLSAIVSMVDSTGLDQTRAWLRARKSMRGVGGHLFALHSWANGVADPTWFWRLARSARTSGSLFQELCAGQQQMDPALRAVFDPQSTSWDAVALDGPAPDGKSYGLVLAPSLGGVGSRLEFFRALEVLLLVDRNRTVLATPVWTDGTLDLDHLLARLRAAEGKPIGPLDLVQALHRLRNCDTARVEELDRLQATGGIWRTAPALTSPDGDESWNVLEVIRTWVGEGGLPPLDPIRGSDGLWTAQGKSPVPWSRCRAAPAELRDNRWSPSAGCDMVSDGRIFPLWPDRTLPAQEPREVHTIPARLPGSFGQPLHEAFLSMLAWGIEMRNRNAMAVARLTLRNAKVSTWHYQNAVRSRCEAGRLNVDDLACATEAMFEHGCLAQFWAPSLAAADTLCTLGNTPVSGLDRFLKVLAEYVPEVPEPVVPPGLRAFAAMPGTAKAHRAARALVEALETSEATP